MTTIYVLKHPLTNEPRYVGKTIHSLGKRLAEHLREARRGIKLTHKNNWINSLLAEGLTPLIEVVDTVGENWAMWEIYYISWYQLLGYRLTNHTAGGEGISGYKLSDETKRKIGDANRGRSVSNETRAKIGDANRGRQHSDETRAKIGASGRGRVVNEEAKQKIAHAMRTRVVSAETRLKIAMANRNRALKMIPS